MTRSAPWLHAVPVALLLGGCVAVTVNMTFPQEKIDSAASSIEDLVRSTGPTPAPARPEPTGPKSEGPGVSVHVRTWLGVTVAEAQVPELKTRTPEIMAAIQSRSRRYPELAAAMTQGCIGENAQGLVELRPGTGCPPNVTALVAAENGDRELMYRILMEQNNMASSEAPKVRAAFAKANREKVPAGTWVQEPDGQWRRT